MRAGLLLTLLSLGVALLGTGAACAQLDRSTIQQNLASEDQIEAVLTQLILDHLPLEYRNEKNWGKQEPRWDGIHFHHEGIQLKTKRRWKQVNHGTWKKYHAEFIDPEQQFSVLLANLCNMPDGKTAFDLIINANLKLHARQAKWVKGVQLYSISADGYCQIQIKLSCQTQILLGLGHFPPDLIFRPQVTAARLSIGEFRLDRISKVGGEVAQQITRWVRETLDNRIREEEVKMVDKLNTKIDKRQHDLKLSLVEALQSKWLKQSTEFLPESVRTALSEK